VVGAGIGLGGALAAATILRLPVRGAVALLGVAAVVGLGAGAIRAGSVEPAGGSGSVEALPLGEAVRLAGVVADEPVPRGENQDVVLENLRRAEGAVTGAVVVRVPRAVPVSAGDEVLGEITFREADAGDPIETAYRERLARQGIGQLGRAFDLEVIGHRSSPVGDAFGAVRRWLLDGLVRTVPEPEASLGAGILLGVRAGIDPAIRDAFAVAGLSHVVAISGWNVAIVVALIMAATRRLRERLGPTVPAAVALVAVAAYVVLVGASPAVVRAALMAAALMVGRLGGSPAHAGSALMAAVVVMLLVTPAALWDIGFQLSALATGGLLLFAGPIEARLDRWPAWLRTPLALTVAAQLATLPVLLAAFGQVSLVAPLANVVVVPLIPLVMAGAAAAAVVGGLASALPVPLLADLATWLGGGVAWLPLHGLIGAGTAAAAMPLAAVPLGGGPWLSAAWYPAVLLLARRITRRRPPHDPALVEAATGGASHVLPESAALSSAAAWLGRPRRVAVALVAAVAVATALSGSDGRLHLVVLDIGQGDAILIEAPNGATTLVDGGVDPDLTLRRIGQELPFHERRIDVVILSHPHQDHLGGLEEVFRRYEVGAFVDPGRTPETDPYRRLLDAVALEGATLETAEAGLSIPLGGGATLEILYPSAADRAAPLPDGDVNNGSVVAILRYGSFEALLTGDAEAPVEALLAARGLLEPVDVLKVGHHGSDSGTTAELLAAIRPSVAVISLGEDNEYGHPHRSTLDHLAAVPGLRVYRTDRDGSVEITTDGMTYAVGPGG
jgi:competence protein ComEC